MRITGVVLIALALSLVGAAAMAQTVCVPSTTQPSVSQAQPPMVTGETAVVVATPSIPAGFGAGPVVELAAIPRGDMFDAAYARLAYQQHADVIALANLGAQRAVDPNLRSFSSKIVNERIDMNEKLVQWYPQFVPGGVLTADMTRAEDIRNEFTNVSDADFDRIYAAALVSLIQQENRMANEGTFKASYAGLYDQSNLVHRVTYNEIKALQNFLFNGQLRR